MKKVNALFDKLLFKVLFRTDRNGILHTDRILKLHTIFGGLRRRSYVGPDGHLYYSQSYGKKASLGIVLGAGEWRPEYKAGYQVPDKAIVPDLLVYPIKEVDL